MSGFRFRGNSETDADGVIDKRGELCPLPIIALGLAASKAPGGTRLTLLADDPAALHDVPAWCRMRGADVVTIEELDGYWRFVVRTRSR